MRGHAPAVRRAFAAPTTDQDFAAFAASQSGRIEEFPPSLSYPAGVVLFRQGGSADEVFYLEHGLVKLVRLQPSGEETIVGLRSAGWFLGAAAVVLGRAYAVTALTVTPCGVARIRAAQFRQQLRSNGALSWRVHGMHSEEIYTEITRVADDRSRSARERLERFLEQLLPALGASSDGRSVGIHVPLRQWEIAHLIGVTPQYLCQLLHEMEGEGVIRREGNVLSLCGTRVGGR